MIIKTITNMFRMQLTTQNTAINKQSLNYFKRCTPRTHLCLIGFCVCVSFLCCHTNDSGKKDYSHFLFLCR